MVLKRVNTMHNNQDSLMTPLYLLEYRKQHLQTVNDFELKYILQGTSYKFKITLSRGNLKSGIFALVSEDVLTFTIGNDLQVTVEALQAKSWISSKPQTAISSLKDLILHCHCPEIKHT